MACGRRFGKSILGINRLVGPALTGSPVAWFSPTYKMLEDIWRDLRDTLQPVTVRRSEQQHRIELLGGGLIDMWSMEAPDSVRGRHYRRVVLDEAAMVGDLENTWQAAIRATLTDLRGDAWWLSTPRGMNFFWRCYERGLDAEQPDWACWQMPTTANPYIAAAEVDEARGSLPERVFQQEYLAAFLEDAGGVFRGVTKAVDAGRTGHEPAAAGVTYTLGVDLARVADFTVLAVVDNAGRQVYFERFNQISWERQIAAIRRVAAAYGARVILDSTGLGDPVFEQLRKSGVPVQGYQLTNTSKEALIDHLAMRIEQGHARLMDVPVQTAELLAYQYEMTPSRNVRMNAPAGMHDDCVIALALATWGCRRVERARPWRGTRGGWV